MKIQVNDKTVHLTYSTNVHPSESISQINQFLEETTVPLKKRIAPDQDFGLGLYLPASVVNELTENEYRRWEWDSWFQKQNMYWFTLNAFPFGDFHSERVKEKVFEPAWTEASRLDYTKKAADLLVRWLPDGVKGSISTHSGRYGKADASDPVWDTVAENLTQAALHFSRIQQKTGKTIVLSLEPEPCSLIDRTPEFISFYQDVLIPRASSILQRRWSLNFEQSEELIRKHIGVCFDTCHLSVLHENLEESLAAYGSAGIPIGKAQISVALKVDSPGKTEEKAQRLQSFAEPRYFHQATLGKGNNFELHPDLEPALNAPGFQNTEQLRSHFHVPIFWEGDETIGTTRDDIENLISKLAGQTDHLEIETYTWDVIPEATRCQVAPDLVTSLEREFQWVLERI